MAAVFFTFFLLVYFSKPIWINGNFIKMLGANWLPLAKEFGMLPMIAGSLYLSVGALSIAFPFSVGICGFVYTHNNLISEIVDIIINFMTSIPTVVFAFIGVFYLVPFLRDIFQKGSGFSLVPCILTLSVLILPTITIIINSGLKQIDRKIFISLISMGISPYIAFYEVILPLLSKSLIAALILGFGRALGDTLVSLMISGNSPVIPGSLTQSFRTLTSHIALLISSDSQSLEYSSIYFAAILLFVMSFSINLTIRLIFKEKY